MLNRIIATTFALATAASAAMADDTAPPSWTGLYVGGDLGARENRLSWNNSTAFLTTARSQD